MTVACPASIATFLQDKVFFGNKPTPELIAILTVYFVQGILGLARLAISFFFKDELGLSPAEVSALAGIAVLPWAIKPAFGLLSDSVPLLGYRRRPYLVLSGIVGSLSWLAFATLVDSTATAVVVLLLSSLSMAVSDVIVDSQVVERARVESLDRAGSLQSVCWGASALGGVITAYLSGWLLELWSPRAVFAVTAIFPLLVSAVAWAIAETPVSRGTARPQLRDQIRQLWGGIAQKPVWMPALFVFVWQATPTADSALFFFQTNELGFEPEFLGRIRLVTNLASLAGIWVFYRFLKTVPFRRLFVWTTVLSALLGLMTLILVTHANRALGIDDRWFSLGDSLILAVMGQVAFMPVLVLSARLCPRGVEATLFALLMSLWNLSGVLSHEAGALLTHWLGVTETEFDNLWLLVLLTNASTLLPLPLVGLLPNGDPGAQPPPAREGEVRHSQAAQPGLPLAVPDWGSTLAEIEAYAPASPRS